MTPAEQLLLLLARGRVAPDTRARARALIEQGVDWPRLLDLTDEHGVAPLLARAIGALGPTGAPEWALTTLAEAWRLNAARNLLVARALAEVLATLRDRGIRAIPLKGVALAESLYGDVGLRVCSDIDVLVPRDAVAVAVAALHALGYRAAEGEPEAGAGDLDLLLAGNIEHALVRPGALGCPLELHWGVAWRWPRDDAALADIWAEARPSRAAGIDAWALSPEWEFLYLAIHAARHRWERLKWLVDLHEVATTRAIDWGRVRDTADRFGLDGVAGIALAACRALFDTPAPPGIAVAALPRWARVFPARPDALGCWREGAFPARLFRARDRLPYLARVAFLPTLAERRVVRLPAALGPLYCVLRPLRLAGRWSASAVRHGLGLCEARPARARHR